MKLTKLLFLGVFCLSSFCALAQKPLWQGKGRIAISSDGNEHDHDDWAATPLSLAMLSSQGLQDKLVLYTYADHVWSSNQDKPLWHGKSAYEHIRESALGAKERFGFDNSNFICAVDHAEIAYNAMRDVINDSSKENPLIIIAAGPMQVVGEALNRADVDKRKYVTVLSHSVWNNEHSDACDGLKTNTKKPWDIHTGWTFDEMKDAFSSKKGGGTKFISILNQNGGDDYQGCKAPIAEWDWLKNSSVRNLKVYKEGSWDWLYSRVSLARTKYQSTTVNFDASDAGMMIYLLTGVEKTNVDMVREILENPKVN